MARKHSDFTVQPGAGKCGPCFEWTKSFLVACFRNGKLPLWCVGSCRLHPVDVGVLSDSTNASPVQEVSWVIPLCFSHFMLATIYCIICASIDLMLCSVLLMRWKNSSQTWQSSRYHASVMTGSNEWEGRRKLPRFGLLCFCFIWRSNIWQFSLNHCFWNCVSARLLLLGLLGDSWDLNFRQLGPPFQIYVFKTISVCFFAPGLSWMIRLLGVSWSFDLPEYETLFQPLLLKNFFVQFCPLGSAGLLGLSFFEHLLLGLFLYVIWLPGVPWGPCCAPRAGRS